MQLPPLLSCGKTLLLLLLLLLVLLPVGSFGSSQDLGGLKARAQLVLRRDVRLPLQRLHLLLILMMVKGLLLLLLRLLLCGGREPHPLGALGSAAAQGGGLHRAHNPLVSHHGGAIIMARFCFWMMVQYPQNRMAV